MPVLAALGCSSPGGGTPDDGGIEDAAEPEATPSGATCADGSTLTYETFGLAFFDDYCQRCHASTVVGAERLGAPSSITYDDVENIRARAVEIDENAAAGPLSVNTIMPPGPPRPAEEERRRLGEWLACGAP
ncbi:MAG: hypothetical protein HY907_06530 [Deltaproteobacteria bacterium]|nr:hypothetical protein [Deltaproteobacteria bacterium]